MIIRIRSHQIIRNRCDLTKSLFSYCLVRVFFRVVAQMLLMLYSICNVIYGCIAYPCYVYVFIRKMHDNLLSQVLYHIVNPNCKYYHPGLVNWRKLFIHWKCLIVMLITKIFVFFPFKWNFMFLKSCNYISNICK